MDKPPHGSPASSFFAVQETPSAGRGVFATQDIPKGTQLWTTENPTAEVILREYRRELCAQCFGYNRGRNLKLRDNSVGFAYCSSACQHAWLDAQGEDGVQAWKEVEKLNKGCSRQPEMVDAFAPHPDEDDIETAWDEATSKVALIREARGPNATKIQRKALAAALSAPPVPDTLSFLLSGILMRARHPEMWPSVLALWPNSRPYKSEDELEENVRSFLQLVAVLPASLQSVCTADTCYELATRDNRNSFGIRSLDDDGAEFFGYGTWPSASYFNHSCDPNVSKKREGRMWRFTAGRNILKGEELCITYLSGEERALGTKSRRELLKNAWGFRCGCDRCRAGA